MSFVLSVSLLAALVFNVAACALAAVPQPYQPGDFAPTFTVNALGNYTSPYVYSQDSGPLNGKNVVALRIDEVDLFVMNFFNCNVSIDTFLRDGFAAPSGMAYSTTFMFFSSPGQKNILVQVRDKIYNRLGSLPLSDSEKASIKQSLFFGEELPSFFETVFSSLLTRERYVSVATSSGPAIPRLDGQYGWAIWPCSDNATATSCTSGTVVAAASTCTLPDAKESKGKFVLVQLTEQCDVYGKISAGEKNGAAGIIFSQAAGGHVFEVGAIDPLIDGATIIVTMIPYEGGQLLLKQIQAGPNGSANIAFSEPFGKGKFLGIDGFGKLRSVGWEKFPVLMTLGWQSWWFNRDYQQTIEKQSQPALVVPVFQQMPSGGSWTAKGAAKNISIPQGAAEASNLEIDFALSCKAATDFGCGIWDRVVSVFICCEHSPKDLCGVELARYITAFRRGEGSWITDISHLKPLLPPGGMCEISIQSTPELWYVTMDLRYVRSASAANEPAQIVPLWNGQFTFDKTYNNRSAVKVTLSKGTTTVILSTVITGHGYDDYGCGEFCATTHQFSLEDAAGKEIAAYMQNFSLPDTDSQFGCANYGYRNGVAVQQVNGGGDVAFPNEHGTWTNGERVSPWLQEIDATGLPSTFWVHYSGYFRGKTPDPQHSPGYMVVQTYMTQYKSK